MFSAETLHFLTDLRSNNSRDWFQANRARYDAHVAGAAQGFGDALAAELQRLAGRPVTPKLFRLHRDLRFSKDKTPYNAHVHMSFSAGGPFAWLVGIDPGGLVLGYGALGFDAALLGRWRQAVDGPGGPALGAELTRLVALGHRLSAPDLKRVPAPYPAGHPQADLLRRKSFAIWQDQHPMAMAYGPGAPARLAQALQVWEPLRGLLAAV